MIPPPRSSADRPADAIAISRNWVPANTQIRCEADTKAAECHTGFAETLTNIPEQTAEAATACSDTASNNTSVRLTPSLHTCLAREALR
jgi:hypothetical protein